MTQTGGGTLKTDSGYDAMMRQLEWLRKRIIDVYGERGREMLENIDRKNEEDARKREEGMERAKTFTRREIESYNASTGKLVGFDCPTCKNRGYIAVESGYGMALRPCECMKARAALKRIKKSGLSDMLAGMTFDTYQEVTAHSKKMKQVAMEYANSPDGWLYFGGQSGSGKTHLCTAICGQLLNKGNAVLYMIWPMEIEKLNQIRFDKECEEELDKFRNVPILYIDDFLKTEDLALPDSRNVKLALNILNARYNAKRRTIISSEWMISELLNIDEALGSRIYEMAKKHILTIERDKNKNWRLRRAK